MKIAETIPASFASIAEAAEFWDTHDLSDYEGQTQDIDAIVKLERRSFLTALEPDFNKLTRPEARRRQK